MVELGENECQDKNRNEEEIKTYHEISSSGYENISSRLFGYMNTTTIHFSLYLL